MREDPDVNSACRADQTADRTSEQPSAQILFGAVTDENLGDAVGAGEVDDGLDDRFAIKNLDVQAFAPGLRQTLFEGSAILQREPGLAHIDGKNIAMEARGAAASAGEHLVEISARRETDEKALVHAPGFFEAVRAEIALQAGVNDVGGKNQGHFAQDGAAFTGAFGWRIHDDDFVGGVEEFAGNDLRDALAGELFDRVALVFDVLKIDGADDGDAGLEELFNVLPAVSVAAAGRIVVREAVHEADLRAPRKNSGDVHGLAAFGLQRSNDFERGEDGLDVGRNFGLNSADDHVLAAFAATAAFVKHAEGFADAGSVAEKNLEAAAYGRRSVFGGVHGGTIVTRKGGDKVDGRLGRSRVRVGRRSCGVFLRITGL